jgi:aminobenzoyl-glutamate utilization protein B
MKGAKVLQKNMNLVGPIVYTEEIAFGNKLMQENGMEGKGINKTIEVKRRPYSGSTDVGDVSYIVPEISLLATTAPRVTMALLDSSCL